MDVETSGTVEQITLQAKVIRANGTEEDLGVVAEWDRRWWKRLLIRLRGSGRVHYEDKR